MPRKNVVSDTYVFDAFMFDRYRDGGTNLYERKKMLNLIYRAMKRELTDYEFFCLKEYYLSGKKMKDIAAERGVHPSTVTRQIQRAKEKLSHIADYY